MFPKLVCFAACGVATTLHPALMFTLYGIGGFWWLVLHQQRRLHPQRARSSAPVEIVPAPQKARYRAPPPTPRISLHASTPAHPPAAPPPIAPPPLQAQQIPAYAKQMSAERLKLLQDTFDLLVALGAKKSRELEKQVFALPDEITTVNAAHDYFTRKPRKQ